MSKKEKRKRNIEQEKLLDKKSSNATTMVNPQTSAKLDCSLSVWLVRIYHKFESELARLDPPPIGTMRECSRIEVG